MKKENLQVGTVYQSILSKQNILIVRINQTGKVVSSVTGKYYNEIKGEYTTVTIEDNELISL